MLELVFLWCSDQVPDYQTHQCTLEVSQKQPAKFQFDPCCPRHTVAIKKNLDKLKTLTCLLAFLHALLFCFSSSTGCSSTARTFASLITEQIYWLTRVCSSDWLFCILFNLSWMNCGLKSILVVCRLSACLTVPFLIVIRPTHSCCPNVDMHSRISFSFVFISPFSLTRNPTFVLSINSPNS